MTADEWQLLESLRGWLEARGYELVANEDRHGLDQGFDSYQGSLARIVITADRGQWFLDFIPNGAPPGRYDMEVWSHALGGPQPFHGPTTAASWRLEPQLGYLREHLHDMEAACRPAALPATLDALATAAHATAAFPAGRPRDLGETD